MEWAGACLEERPDGAAHAHLRHARDGAKPETGVTLRGSCAWPSHRNLHDGGLDRGIGKEQQRQQRRRHRPQLSKALIHRPQAASLSGGCHGKPPAQTPIDQWTRQRTIERRGLRWSTADGLGRGSSRSGRNEWQLSMAAFTGAVERLSASSRRSLLPDELLSCRSNGKFLEPSQCPLRGAIYYMARTTPAPVDPVEGAGAATLGLRTRRPALSCPGVARRWRLRYGSGQRALVAPPTPGSTRTEHPLVLLPEWLLTAAGRAWNAGSRWVARAAGSRGRRMATPPTADSGRCPAGPGRARARPNAADHLTFRHEALSRPAR